MPTGSTSAGWGLRHNRVDCALMLREIYCAGRTIVPQKVMFQSMC
jgi:hypothetical protein